MTELEIYMDLMRLHDNVEREPLGLGETPTEFHQTIRTLILAVHELYQEKYLQETGEDDVPTNDL